MSWNAIFRPGAVLATLALTACASYSPVPSVSTSTPPASVAATGPADLPEPEIAPVRIGLALGGGATKGFAHIGVIKVLEANGFTPEVVAGTSVGSVVGALYASGMDAQTLEQKAMALNEGTIRDLQLSAAGLVKGRKLQDFINEQVGNQPLDKLPKPFVAVATRLEDGKRTVFARGNTGQAVRASSSIPGLFEAVKIGKYHYVDGGVISPVPVDAARELGADVVVAVDISDKPRGKTPTSMLDTMNQSIAIMGQKLGQLELANADVVVRPQVLDIGTLDFSKRSQAIAEGEKAALAALPELQRKVQQVREQRLRTAWEQLQQKQAASTTAQMADQAATNCPARSSWQKLADTVGLGSRCE